MFSETKFREQTQCKCAACKADRKKRGFAAYVELDPKLVKIIRRIYDKLGWHNINSGYRCPPHNKAVGGKPKSEHKEKKAVDVAVADNEDKLAVIKEAQILGIGGVGVYGTFVHLDTGKKRNWKG